MSNDNEIGDEAAFCRALDINPDVVESGSIKINMQGGKALLEFRALLPVTHAQLAAAMLAASQPKEEGLVAVPQDHKPPAKKAAARKAPAKKTSTPRKKA